MADPQSWGRAIIPEPHGRIKYKKDFIDGLGTGRWQRFGQRYPFYSNFCLAFASFFFWAYLFFQYFASAQVTQSSCEQKPWYQAAQIFLFHTN